MKTLITRDDFIAKDIENTDFRKMDELLASGAAHDAPWANEREGWRTSTVTIGPTADTPATHAIPGQHFTVVDFHHKSLCAEIKKTLESDPAARDFVLDPYFVEHAVPGAEKVERVYGEFYNSEAFVQEDIRLQNSPREPGCDLPRVVMAIMLWSDATVVSQFGGKKAWPGYMYFGNQSKYTRARPTAHAAHHIAYFISLPDRFQDFVRAQTGGKAATAALLTHCRRELFHAQWGCLLDEEFLAAYEHGMVIDCIDGVRRRVYPRIFTYSADYPEKMLIATLRDKGRCPCPRCLTNFDRIPALGTTSDRERRQTDCRTSQHRPDNANAAPPSPTTSNTTPSPEMAVQQARDLIYNDGYVVNSEHVERLLSECSLIIQNAFMSRLGKFGFEMKNMLVVDQLHEFELGVWKAIFKQLVRILEAERPDLIHILNERFRQVPTFAWTTIRKFADNVCEMKQMAACDFEDILQCVIPCFEGLLPEIYGDAITTLLFVSAYWHALAKMRLHTDTSLTLLDDTTRILGSELQHFAYVTCAAFNTRETQGEYEARKRAEERRTKHTNSEAVHPLSTPFQCRDPATTGRRPRTFNLQTVKTHFLRDYVATIKMCGTTDSYTTHIGEHEHRHVKAMREHTNNINPDGQVVEMDAHESRMRLMAQELSDIGLDIPGVVSHSGDVAEPIVMRPEEQYSIGDTEKNFVDLGDWQEGYPHDPAIQVRASLTECSYNHLLKTFVPLLKDHLRLCLRDTYPALLDPQVPIILHHDRVYAHATAHFNYTTYDLQRDQDIIHPSARKADILVYTPDEDPATGATIQSGTSCYPWTYARVHGIYHANIVLPGRVHSLRLDFLHVRWFQTDTSFASGAKARRLERIHFVPSDSGDPFGFVDPSHVIRACHLIPTFHYQRTKEYLPTSFTREVDGDWKYFYVNRCDYFVQL
ncbi:hypothetical protein LXA43DRAFT_889833 [Ganoderma leucocontextum]|nr:hypothetical protein LXA43DRAFT_889833 [Ganoderma leucocontextum]